MNTENIFNPHEWLEIKSAESEHPASAIVSSTGRDASDIETITSRIEESCVDITSSYADWRDLGFALSDALGEAGRDYFHRLSRFHPEYSAIEADKQYDRCLKAGGHGITIKTFFQLAKAHGISLVTRTMPVRERASYTSVRPAEGIEVSEGMREMPDQVGHDDSLPTFTPQIHKNLPDFLRKIIDVADSPEDGDILLLGTLTVLSACLPQIEGIYNKRPVSSNLFLFVTARASSGKGRLTLCRYLIEPIHERLREINEAEMMEYKQKMQMYNASKNKGSMEKPEQPPLRMLFIPANSSATAVYQVLGENDGQGIMFETEGDTLANTFASDYGNYSDGFRKAFHHETISYVRRKDREYVNLKHPKLSALLTGTPKQVSSLITDAENGLFSRFIFYYLSTKVMWQNVFEQSGDRTLDDQFRALGDEFHDFHTLLADYGKIRFHLTCDQQRRFNAFFERTQVQYVDEFGEDIIASVRRLGLITYRIAMIMSALRIMEDGCFEDNIICRDIDFETALIISDALLHHTTKIFEELPRLAASASSTAGQKTIRRQLFMDKLPESFTRKEFIDISASLGIPLKTAERHISQWCKDGLIERIEQGKYLKR
ncbi:MAG: DUF3987 domain-containing protein [Bacteroidales bacterium]|nr:DUF3987 domain-containing protein [Bacteroidales bacterium]